MILTTIHNSQLLLTNKIVKKNRTNDSFIFALLDLVLALNYIWTDAYSTLIKFDHVLRPFIPIWIFSDADEENLGQCWYLITIIISKQHLKINFLITFHMWYNYISLSIIFVIDELFCFLFIVSPKVINICFFN